jgi:hypothetical protein
LLEDHNDHIETKHRKQIMTPIQLKALFATFAAHEVPFDERMHAFDAVRNYVASESYKLFQSSYDNGWERGFILQAEEGYYVVREVYAGGAGYYNYHFYDTVLKALCCMSERLVAEVAAQELGRSPKMTFVA